jgi:hypothetical protein
MLVSFAFALALAPAFAFRKSIVGLGLLVGAWPRESSAVSWQ